MARIRSLKPEFFLSERVAGTSFSARLFFQGLWTVADREGRLRWQARKLKAQIFPYDTIDVAALAEELVEARLVRFYDDDEGVYLFIPGFTEHQRPHPKEPASILPPYPSGRDHGWLPWKKTAPSRELPGSIPSSPVGREGKVILDLDQEGKGAGTGRSAPPAPLIASPLAWDRKHGTHLTGFCDWVCFPEDLANQFAGRAGWPDVTAVAGWAQRVREEWQAAGRVPSERMYDFWNARWAEAHPAPKVTKPDWKVEAAARARARGEAV